MKTAIEILQEETGGFENQSRLRDDVLDAMEEYAKQNEARIEELTKLCELVYKSFGGGNVITFSEKDIENFRKAVAPQESLKAGKQEHEQGGTP